MSGLHRIGTGTGELVESYRTTYATGGVVPRDRAVVIGEGIPPFVMMENPQACMRPSGYGGMKIEVDAGGAIRAFGAIARKLDELTARRRPALRPSRFPRRPIERPEAIR